MTDSFTMTERFNVDPERIYKAWLDGKSHALMTGGPAAESDAVPGGSYTAWDGYISGIYVELEPIHRLSMQWRTSEFAADAADSRLEIVLVPDGKGTILTLTHEGLPAGTADEYENGWRDYYFVPMQEHFSQESI